MEKKHAAHLHFVSGVRGIRREMRNYALLLILPLLLGIALYAGVRNVMDRLMEENTSQLIQRMEDEFDTRCDDAADVAGVLMNTASFQEIVSQSDPGQNEIMAFCELCKEYTEISTQIDHFYLISSFSGVVYSDTGYYDQNAKPNILIKCNLTQADLDAAKAEEGITRHLLTRNGFAPSLLISVENESSGSKDVLIVSLNSYDYLQVFTGLDATFCAIFNEDCYITSMFLNMPADFDWYSNQDISRLTGVRTVTSYREVDGSTFLVSLPRGEYYQPLFIIIIAFIIYLALVLIIGSFYLYGVSRRRMRQLSSLVELLPNQSDDDLSYANILGQVQEELQNEQEEDRRRRESTQLLNLLHENYSKNIPDSMAENLRIGQNVHYYTASFYIRDFTTLTLKTASQADTYTLLNALIPATLNSLCDDTVFVNTCEEQHIWYTVFGSSLEPEAFRDKVMQICRSAIDMLFKNYGVDAHCTVSKMAKSVSDLPESYSETKSLRQFALSIDSQAALVSQEGMFFSQGSIMNGDFFKQEQLLINTLLVRKYEMVPPMVSAILNEHVASLRQDYEVVQNRLGAVASILAESLIAAHIPGMDVPAAANRLRESESVAALNQNTEEIFSQAAELAGANSDENHLLDLSVSYIRDHLGDHLLDVNAVCDFAGVSVKRLNRLFMHKYSLSIADYINRCRIDKAKELLGSTKMTVVQVSDAVGYNSKDTLTRNFRKFEGITPTEYRKMI